MVSFEIEVEWLYISQAQSSRVMQQVLTSSKPLKFILELPYLVGGRLELGSDFPLHSTTVVPTSLFNDLYTSQLLQLVPSKGLLTSSIFSAPYCTLRSMPNLAMTLSTCYISLKTSELGWADRFLFIVHRLLSASFCFRRLRNPHRRPLGRGADW